MSRNSLIITIVICMLLVLASIVLYPLVSEKDHHTMTKNDDVVAIDNFNIQDEHTGTCTTGSAIVQKNDDELLLKLIGNVHISEKDIGGVCFYFEKDLHIESILTSYKDELNASGVNTGDIPFEKPYPKGTFLSIGRTPESGGGDGYFEITCLYLGNESIESISSISFSISAGSYYDGNHQIIGAIMESFVIKC